MLRFAALAVLFAAACAVPINFESKSGDPNVTVVDNIEDYLAENPGAEFIGEFENIDFHEGPYIKTYKFGQHVSGTCMTLI